MHHRYPAPHASRIFHDDYVIQAWAAFTKRYMIALVEERSEELDWAEDLRQKINQIPIPSAASVRTREATLGHEVVAFLSVFLESTPQELVPLVHYGLTSSDLTENTLHSQMRTHAGVLVTLSQQLEKQIHERWISIDTPRPGRTHGQIAEITSFGNQALVYLTSLEDIRSDLTRLRERLDVTKWPGPTGQSAIHRTPLTTSAVPSTQIIPRDRLLQWVALYARLVGVLENLALLVRTGSRSEVGELREGATVTRRGSSAMPTKENPIDSEKVCGLAKIARGYASALIQTGTWDDRDLSNSSAERVAVADLAWVVEHMLITMTDVAGHLNIYGDVMNRNAMDPRCWTNVMQSAVQDICHVGPIQASGIVKDAFVRPPRVLDNDGKFRFYCQILWNIIVLQFDEERANAVHTQVLSAYNEMFPGVIR